MNCQRSKSIVADPVLRLVSICLMTIAMTIATCVPAAGQTADGLSSTLLPLIRSHQGDVGVCVLDLTSGTRFNHRESEVMPTASLIKFPVMVETYRQIAAGTLDESMMLTLQAAGKVPGSGVLTKHFSDGAQVSLRDAIRLMIALSDNTATNLVVDQIGLPATSKTMSILGYPQTKLNSKVYRGGSSIFPERSKSYGLGSTTAADIVDLLEKLHHRQLVTPEYCAVMLTHLKNCEAKSQLPRFLPADIEVAHKSGSVSNARCDAGIIYAPNGPILLCMLTNNNEDRRWTHDNAAELLNARIAKTVYEYFNPPHATEASADKVLNQGDYGLHVESVQRTLNARMDPSPELSIDGDYGPATAAAVVRFQSTNKLPPTGIVGPETWKTLSPLLTEKLPVPGPADVNGQTLPLAAPDSLEGRPFVSCVAWAIADVGTGDFVGGANTDKALEIASTTKIMTAYLVLRHADSHPESLDEIITFSGRADRTRGSTSGIAEGESLPVSEALYGLLLPSGNDAAVALGEHFGTRLRGNTTVDEVRNDADSLPMFIAAMNKMAGELGMDESAFRNPHGMSETGHHSSARDLLKLSQAAFALPAFRHYVSTRQRGCTVTGAAGYRRNVMWKNTNRLLEFDGYRGIKTGTTEPAGACLVAMSERNGQKLLLVILGSASSSGRYVDARNLFRWAWRKKLGIGSAGTD